MTQPFLGHLFVPSIHSHSISDSTVQRQIRFQPFLFTSFGKHTLDEDMNVKLISHTLDLLGRIESRGAAGLLVVKGGNANVHALYPSQNL